MTRFPNTLLQRIDEAHSTTDDQHQLYKDTQCLKKTSCILLSSQQQLPTDQHPAFDQGECQPSGALVDDIVQEYVSVTVIRAV